MKVLILILTFLIIFSCKQNTETGENINSPVSFEPITITLDSSIMSYYNLALLFLPKSVDLKRCEQIENSNLDFEYINNQFIDNDSLINANKLFLLKLYAYQVAVANQGYDLLGMVNKKTEPIIINCFEKLDYSLKNKHFLNSGKPYEICKRRNNETNIFVKKELIRIDSLLTN